MSDLVAFLSARLDEDETAAKAATPGPWMTGRIAAHLADNVIYGEGIWPGHIQQVANVDYAEHKDGNADHIARHDPARVLREVEAKRKILRHLSEIDVCEDWPIQARNLAHYALLLLAAVYSDHEDYRQEWE